MGRIRSNDIVRAFPPLGLRGWSPQLIALGFLLLLLLVCGGSSRADVPQLIILRPVAVCLVGFALASMNVDTWRTYRTVFLLFAAVVFLVALHLVPLPPALWRALPGRDIIIKIDTLAGLGSIWRPLSMYPEGTWNALYALSVPVAALLLASQLKLQDHLRLLVLILLMSFGTGLVGVIQASGSNFDLYGSGESGVAGVFANRNHQAAFLACTFPMLAGLALCTPRMALQESVVRLIAVAGALTLVPLILVTGSRMGSIAALFAFVYAVSLVARRRSGVLASPRALLLGVLVVGVVSAAAVFVTIYASRDIALQRMSGEGEDLRWLIWSVTQDMLPVYFPWGSGVGSFAPVFQIHEPSEMLMPQYTNQAHNDWLDLVLTAGLPGVLIAVAAVVMTLRAAGSAFATKGVSGTIKQMGIGIIFVLAFASLTDYPARTPMVAALIAIAMVWAFNPAVHQE